MRTQPPQPGGSDEHPPECPDHARGVEPDGPARRHRGGAGRPRWPTAFGVSERTVRKWLAALRAEAGAGLRTAPAGRAGSPATPAALRRAGSSACAGSAGPAPRSPRRCSSAALHRRRLPAAAGLARLRALEPPVPVARYERAAARRPAAPRHQEARPLRPRRATASPAIAGAGCAASAGSTSMSPIDDASRLAYVEVLPDERRRRRRRGSSGAPWPGFGASASGSRGS